MQSRFTTARSRVPVVLEPSSVKESIGQSSQWRLSLSSEHRENSMVGECLTVAEEWMLRCVASQLDSRRSAEAQTRFCFNAAEFAKESGLDVSLSFQQLSEATAKLAKRQLIWRDSEGPVEWVQVLSRGLHSRARGLVEIEFTRYAIQQMLQLEQLNPALTDGRR